MIDPNACDLCHVALNAHVFEVQLTRGTIGARSNQRWAIAPRTAGIRLFLMCQSCGEYVMQFMTDMTQQVQGTTPVTTPVPAPIEVQRAV